MIRDFRPTDTPVLVEFLTTQFPEEEAIMGSHPDRFFKVVKRVYRWDFRLFIGIARLIGKPLYRFFVVEEGGRVVATTMLSFPAKSVYISMVATDPSVRRRGFARALLLRSQELARKMGRQFLVLDVLSENAPARALYEGRLGYVPLRETAFVVHDHSAQFGPERTMLPKGVRRYQKSDEANLLAIARSQTPPEVARVLPRKVTGLSGSRMEERIFDSQTAAWVVDRGQGAEAGIGVVSSPDADAAHFSDPIVSPTADPALVSEMIRVAGAWCAAHHAPRLAGHVPIANTLGRAALEKEGFHAALSVWTLYHPVA
ncbi:MAG: GNAT family N-acetyltransferase [Thermoplasmata archaeon]|nr:GNAT family N-acetyltransferase [Thermoplasmata archaeon]